MKKIKNAVWILIGLSIPVLFILKILQNSNESKELDKNNNIRIRAVVIDERNYMGNSPVSHEFAYSYLFYVGKNRFTGDSHNSKLKIGDSIDVEYLKGNPKLSRAIIEK